MSISRLYTPVLFFLTGIFSFQISQTSGAVTIVEARNFFYSPNSITINAGDTVRFVWIEGNHPTESLTGAWSTFPLNSSSTSFDLVLFTTGFYPFECTIHSGIGMVGDITVNSSSPPCGPGSPPINLMANPSASSVELSWDILANSQLYQVRGQPVGAASPKKKITVPNMLTVNGLLSSTAYEWQVRAICVGTDEITPWSATGNFSTLSPRFESNTNLSYTDGMLYGELILSQSRYELELYTMTGRLMQREYLTGTGSHMQLYLSLNALQAGMYIWTLTALDISSENPISGYITAY